MLRVRIGVTGGRRNVSPCRMQQQTVQFSVLASMVAGWLSCHAPPDHVDSTLRVSIKMVPKQHPYYDELSST